MKATIELSINQIDELVNQHITKTTGVKRVLLITPFYVGDKFSGYNVVVELGEKNTMPSAPSVVPHIKTVER